MKTLICLAFASILVVTTATAQTEDGNGSARVSFLVDFSDYSEGSVEDWLAAKGFKFEQGARDRTKLDLNVDNGELVLDAKKPVSGFLIDESADVKTFSKVQVEWGISKFPAATSYEKGINNEALMLYIFFGYDKISSGSLFIPNSPYFIGLFLCDGEKINFPYKGRYFHKSGRFVCVARPKTHETVITEFEIAKAFKEYFAMDEVPVISGISLGVDTTKAKDGGKARAFIKSITFLE